MEYRYTRGNDTAGHIRGSISFVRDSKETVELAAKEDETTLETAAEFAKNEIKDANNGTDEIE